MELITLSSNVQAIDERIKKVEIAKEEQKEKDIKAYEKF